MSLSILRLPAVKSRTGLSRSSIYARIKQGAFPSPVSIGARAVGWIEREIDEHIAQLIERARADRTPTNASVTEGSAARRSIGLKE